MLVARFAVHLIAVATDRHLHLSLHLDRFRESCCTALDSIDFSDHFSAFLHNRPSFALYSANVQLHFLIIWLASAASDRDTPVHRVIGVQLNGRRRRTHSPTFAIKRTPLNGQALRARREGERSKGYSMKIDRLLI